MKVFTPGAIASGLIAAGLLATAPFVQANAVHEHFVDVAGSANQSGFNNLTGSRINATQLAAGIAANVGGGSATLTRTSGGFYPASAGLYSFSGPSTFQFGIDSPIADLGSLTLQSFANVSTGADGVWGLLSPANLPTLSYNGGTQNIAATTQATQSYAYIDVLGGGIERPASETNPNYAIFTWDLTGISDISSVKLNFGSDAHANLIAFQLDQVAAVPEPGSIALMLAGLGGIGAVTRRRRAARPQLH